MTPDAPPSAQPILVVDDDHAVLRSLERSLHDSGFSNTLVCNDSRQALSLFEKQSPAVVLLDLVMPHLSGEDLLASLKAHTPGIPVIIMTANDDVVTAVRCIQSGAYDYLTKPLDLDRLLATLSRALEVRRLQLENIELRRRAASPRVLHPEWFEQILTQSPALHSVFSYVESIAPSSEPVLIIGETGVGKELIAEALHRASGRQGRLVSVNVAGLDETAFADTLFGHLRGAFTGAAQPRVGLVEEAAGGTLFLDEVGDLKPEMQTKLLRLIQEHEFFPLGGDKPKTSHCRIIAATNRNLRARMRDGHFREDLFFRLNAHLVHVPPLRDRPDDLPLLVDAFLEEAAKSLGKVTPTPPPELLIHLSGYAFRGNVRELRAMIYDAVARHDKGVLSLKTFLDHMDMAMNVGSRNEGPDDTGVLSIGARFPTLKEATGLLMAEALKRAEGNQTAAARMLGITRRTMNRYCTTGQIGSIDDP